MTAVGDLDAHYAALEARFDIRTNNDYARLVVPNGNASEPVHRWFHMKEAFSSNLLVRVIKDLDLVSTTGLRILDPFSGSGTTAVSGLTLATSGILVKPTIYGIESNPFLSLLASAKVNSLLDPPREFLTSAQRIAAAALKDVDDYELPALTTFHDQRYFKADSVQWLMRLRAAIDAAASDEPAVVIDLMSVALASTIEPVSNLRRDGRALRYVERSTTDHPIDVFLQSCDMMASDIPWDRVGSTAAIYHGDGISMEVVDARFAAFDLILCSPPYPNNIDYTEVYKMENWLLGYISSQGEFADQRLATVHSHPSLRRANRLQAAEVESAARQGLESLVEPIVSALPDDRYLRPRREVIEGYAVDMYMTLKSAAARLRSGGALVMVVGNSAHGKGDAQHVIAADLFIARAAELAGLRVRRIEIARRLSRRSCQSPFLRESLVHAEKP